MEPMLDTKARAQAEKVYRAIGMRMPEERRDEDGMRERRHGGGAVVTTFHPTELGPKLNVVHGPLAQSDPLLFMESPVVGLPVVGAGLKARMMSDHPDKSEVDLATMDEQILETAQDRSTFEESPYFYPRRTKQPRVSRSRGRIVKKQGKTRHPNNKPGVRFI